MKKEIPKKYKNEGGNTKGERKKYFVHNFSFFYFFFFNFHFRIRVLDLSCDIEL